MGIFDFFRKKQGEIEKEKIKSENIEDWLNKKNEEIKIWEKNIIKDIDSRISDFIKNSQNRIIILKKINLDNQKIEEKIKLIVKENLNKYIFYLEKLISNLKDIKEKNITGLIKKIDSNFFDFRKKSKINFEKATFLVGKELGELNESIEAFIKNLNKMISENKNSIELSKIISIIESKFKEIQNTGNLEKEILENIGKMNEKRKNLENEIKITNTKMSEIVKSPEYLKETKEKAEFDAKENELKKELYILKSMIDFKSLARIFHKESKKMNILKKYKEDFYENFRKNNGKEILELIIESDIEKSRIMDKFNSIIMTERKIKEESEKIEVSEIAKLEELEKEFKNQAKEINDLKENMDKESKKIKKFEIVKKEIQDFMKNELSKVNIIVEWF